MAPALGSGSAHGSRGRDRGNSRGPGDRTRAPVCVVPEGMLLAFQRSAIAVFGSVRRTTRLVAAPRLRHDEQRAASFWPLHVAGDGYGGPAPCDGDAPLQLEDARRGVVAYVNGAIHLLGLADGSDRVLARGTIARFIDSGLVYADGARLRLAHWAEVNP